MIRPAIPEDAPFVAPLLVQAMKELARKFAGSENASDAIPIFEHFFKLSDNQYSFLNTLIYEDEKGIAGSITMYDGALLEKLRALFLKFLSEKHGIEQFNIEPETEAGEFYLDTVSVNPDRQGKGIGQKLLMAACEHARMLGHKWAGLLVNPENPSARKLYERLGFQEYSIRTLGGSKYFHMRKALEN